MRNLLTMTVLVERTESYSCAHSACFMKATRKWHQTCENARCHFMSGGRPGSSHMARHLCGAKGVASAKPIVGIRGPQAVISSHRNATMGGTYGASDTTQYGNEVHPIGAVRVTEGLAGPCQSSQRPHRGLLGARMHYGVGIARTSNPPASGAQGVPRATLNLGHRTWGLPSSMPQVRGPLA